jgi:hypothetical protein
MRFQIVMRGFVPPIHVFLILKDKTWMAGTSPAMTIERCSRDSTDRLSRESGPDRDGTSPR